MPTQTTVAILIVSYNGLNFLGPCLDSIVRLRTRSSIRVLVIDNASTDGSVSFIKERYRTVEVVALDQNKGFAEGNNVGWEYIRSRMPDVGYVYLLNQDTIMDADALDPLVDALSSDHTLGAVQSLLVMADQPHIVNSIGNAIHFLGFGYSTGNGVRRDQLVIERHDIAYASGAAVMIPRRTLESIGLFEDFMFMYLEDLDFGWRLWASGRRCAVIPESIVRHAYEFKSRMRHYYYFERNRIWILLRSYHVLTLVCLIPAFIIMESAQLIMSIVRGTFIDKLRSYGYFIMPSHVRHLFRARRQYQQSRHVSDRVLLAHFTGRIDFQPLESRLLKFVANPFFSTYFKILKRIVVW